MTTHAEIDKVLSILARKQGTTMLERIGRKYNAYEVLISTILSARAKDEVTEVVSENLFKKYPTIDKLAKADKKDVIKIIRKIGFYNQKAKYVINTAKIVMEKFEGKVPDTIEELTELPGVGRKVASCVLVYSFEKEALPVDTHVHQISNRLGWVRTKTAEQTEKRLTKIVPRKHWLSLNNIFVDHGKTICVPVSPFCSKCPVYKYCKRNGVKKFR
ncbi:G/T mismatches repair enzyme [uncultured archaeon]|nr:G/T mismatches repair enzyme [uncultured archaeon]